ncbi:MAG: HDOD domain-containing protein [Porticoccaceae bacterium]|nr:HDOD domain-containing protein [Porticoccaceae bacterium]
MNSIGFEFVQSLSEELSKGTVKLPSLPDIAMKIKTILEDPEVSAKQVARVVSTEATFSARLLKVANSAALNSSGNTIKDIPTAITRMGFKMAHSIAVAIAMDQVLNAHSLGKLDKYFKDLWLHSLNVAAFSYVLAKKQTKIKADEALIAGLLHDVGKIYLLARMEDYPELTEDLQTFEAVIVEWHTGVGAAILEAWRFSEDLVTVADEHEMLDRVPTNAQGGASFEADLADVVQVANLFAHAIEHGSEMEPEWADIKSFQRLKLNDELIHDIMVQSKVEIDSIVSSLQA